MSENRFNNLIYLTPSSTIEEINVLMNSVLIDLQFFLGLEPINEKIIFSFIKDSDEAKDRVTDFFSIGVLRDYSIDVNTTRETLRVSVYESFKNILPVILIREGYFCFIPNEMKNNNDVKIILHNIIDNDLQEKIPQLNPKYKKPMIKFLDQIRDQVVNKELLNTGMERAKDLFKKASLKSSLTPIMYFFEYIRNVSKVETDSKMGKLYYDVFKSFHSNNYEFFRDDEIVDILQNIHLMFYREKKYSKISNIYKVFKEYEQKGIIKTNLSLRKYRSRVEELLDVTEIAPTYKINHPKVNTAVFLIYIRFNNNLKKKNIDKVIHQFPFFIGQHSVLTSFSVEFFGYTIAPSSYSRDISQLLEILKEKNYITSYFILPETHFADYLNLNYYKEYYKEGRFLSPDQKRYDNKYRLTHQTNQGANGKRYSISPLRQIILDRVRRFSSTGLPFAKKLREPFERIKNDFFTLILTQKQELNTLKRYLNRIQRDTEFKSKFQQFLNANKKYSMSYIIELLANLIEGLKAIKKVLSENYQIVSAHQLLEFARQETNLDVSSLINRKELNPLLIKILPLLFTNKNKFRGNLKEYKHFLGVLKSFYDLKIFNKIAIEKIINEETYIENIFQSREEKLTDLVSKGKSLEMEEFVKEIDTMVEEEVMSPLMNSTLMTYFLCKCFIVIIAITSEKTERIHQTLSSFCPRTNIRSGEGMSFFQIYIPNIYRQDKAYLIAYIASLFGKDLILLKRFFNDGFYEVVILRDFYDINTKDYFYTKDLFEDFYVYVHNIFGDVPKPLVPSKGTLRETFLYPVLSKEIFLEQTNNRVYKEEKNFNPEILDNLYNTHLTLNNIITNVEDYKALKTEDFYRDLVKAINIKPVFQSFGLGEYYLYIRPSSGIELDYRLLLLNTFHKVNYVAQVDATNSLLIKYNFPHRSPNDAYINWLAKSKKVIHEYSFFYIKKTYQIFNFEKNFSGRGWLHSFKQFEIYANQILFEEIYRKQPLKVFKIKEFNTGDIKSSRIYGPHTPEFKDLTDVYNTKSVNIKSFTMHTTSGIKFSSIREKVASLVEKGLAYPYLRLRGFGVLDKITIILFDVKEKDVEPLIKIFNFFNYAYVSVIEGQYYIQGAIEEKKFESGLFIKLYFFYNTQFSDFKKILEKVFQNLNINRYLFLNDMVDGKNIVEKAYGDLDFLEAYNPLKNLQWSINDQKWINYKLFNELFEPQYPPLEPTKEVQKYLD